MVATGRKRSVGLRDGDRQKLIFAFPISDDRVSTLQWQLCAPMPDTWADFAFNRNRTFLLSSMGWLQRAPSSVVPEAFADA